MKIHTISIEPTHQKPNGTFLFDTKEIKKKISFDAQESYIISIPPTAFGGNHKHPRREAFVTFSPDLELIWEDENKQLHKEKMMKEKELNLYVVDPFVPHVIVNRSITTPATLIEFADVPQYEVVAVDLLHR